MRGDAPALGVFTLFVSATKESEFRPNLRKIPVPRHQRERNVARSILLQRNEEHTNPFYVPKKQPPCHNRQGGFCYSAGVSSWDSLSSLALAFFLGFCSVSVGIVMSSEIFKGERLQVLTCGDKGCCSRPSPSSLHKQ